MVGKFFEVQLMAEGGGRLVLNEDHIVAVKKRDQGGYRVWLSTELEIGDEPDRLLVLAGTSAPKDVRVFNCQSPDLDKLFTDVKP